MFKWLLLLVGAGIFYLWLNGKKQAKLNEQKTSNLNANKDSRGIKTEVMVQCHHCKVHLPKPDAILHDNRFYCSNEHINTLDNEGWIGSALWRFSPNQEARSENIRPDLVVLHHISLPPGEFRNAPSSSYIVNFFQNKLDPNEHPYFAEIAEQKVSSHFLITRAGELIQFVSTQNKAWHAGTSSFLGREKCNEFSIGIELEGDGDTPFDQAQQKALTKLVEIISSTYPDLQFAGHSDIAPGRKTDPGIYFDWKKFQKETGISSERLPYGLTSR